MYMLVAVVAVVAVVYASPHIILKFREKKSKKFEKHQF
jgi:hypothetical protein